MIKVNDRFQYLSVGEVIDFLKEFPPDLKIDVLLLEETSFTVFVDSKGNGKKVRNKQDDQRLFVFTLPVRH